MVSLLRRRNALLGGMAASVGICAPPIPTGHPRRSVRTEFMESSHYDIRRAMVAWLRVNGDRFLVPVQMGSEQRGSMHCGFPIDWNDPESYTDVEPMTELRLAGLHPAIQVTLARWMMVHVKVRLGWHPLFVASAQPVATATGVWVEAWPVGDASITYATLDEIWHAGLFERFLMWVNDVLVPATHLRPSAVAWSSDTLLRTTCPIDLTGRLVRFLKHQTASPNPQCRGPRNPIRRPAAGRSSAPAHIPPAWRRTRCATQAPARRGGRHCARRP